MSKRKRILVACLLIVVFLMQNTVAFADSSQRKNFYVYEKTDKISTDVLACAEAQIGRRRSDLGYLSTYKMGWSAKFVSDCAYLAGAEKAIPKADDPAALYENVIYAGCTDETHSYDLHRDTPGDLVFFFCPECNQYVQVGIVKDRSYCIMADSDKVEKIDYRHGYFYDSSSHPSRDMIRSFVRPKYNRNSVQTITPEFLIGFYDMDWNPINDIKTGDNIYITYDLYDSISGKLMNDISYDRSYIVTLKLVMPDGTSQTSYSTGTDRAYKQFMPTAAGQYTIQLYLNDDWYNPWYLDFTVRDSGVHIHAPVEIKGYPATCTKDGKTDGSYCSVCGQVLVAQEVIPSTGHSEVIDPAVAPTCTKSGLTQGSHCAECGIMLVEQKIVPASHTWDMGEVTVKPTCTLQGEKTYTCTVCGENKKELLAIDTSNHSDYGTEIINKKEATATEEGYTGDVVCKECGAILSSGETIPKNGENSETTTLSDIPTMSPTVGPTPAKPTAAVHNINIVNGESMPEDYAYAESEIFITLAVKDKITAEMLDQLLVGDYSYSITDNEGDILDISDTVGNGAIVLVSGVGITNLKKTIILLGDVDSDGVVTATDARQILRCSAKLTDLDEIGRLAADLDGDNQITATDARAVLRVSAKLDNPKDWL
ncbi:MAG: dockerin type I repeat-containing protein [Clostridia bacterium]|nr:dockerin type I repeat-containing protein [Clostridia bacterium]